MCYNDISSAICDKALSLLDSHQENFSISVKILALIHSNIDDATRLIVDLHPAVAADYGASVFRDNKGKVKAAALIYNYVWKVLCKHNIMSSLNCKKKSFKQTLLLPA